MSESAQYNDNDVTKIAGAYGNVCTSLTAIGIFKQLDSDDNFRQAVSELREALKHYQEVTPEGLRDRLLQTQDPNLTVSKLEGVLEQHG